MIPDKITCPNCGQESDSINVRQENCLYWNSSNWQWGDFQNDTLTYYCSECGKELPITDELELIVESAE